MHSPQSDEKQIARALRLHKRAKWARIAIAVSALVALGHLTRAIVGVVAIARICALERASLWEVLVPEMRAIEADELVAALLAAREAALAMGEISVSFLASLFFVFAGLWIWQSLRYCRLIARLSEGGGEGAAVKPQAPN